MPRSNKLYDVFASDDAIRELQSMVDSYFFESKNKVKNFLNELTIYKSILEHEPEAFKSSFKGNRVIKMVNFRIHLIYVVEDWKKRIIIHSCVRHTKEG